MRATPLASGIAALCLCLMAFPGQVQPARAEEEKLTGDAELAQELSNPLADLMTIPLQMNYDDDIGPQDDGWKLQTNIQPVIPFELNADWNLITRTIIPVIAQDDILPGAGSQFGLGDINMSLFLSPRRPAFGALTWGVGPVLLLRTATDDLLGGEKWGAGPTGVALTVYGPGKSPRNARGATAGVTSFRCFRCSRPSMPTMLGPIKRRDHRDHQAVRPAPRASPRCSSRGRRISISAVRTASSGSARPVPAPSAIRTTRCIRYTLLEYIGREEVRRLLGLGQSAFVGGRPKRSGEALCDYVQAHRNLWKTLLTGGAASAMREEFMHVAGEIAASGQRANPWIPIDLAVPFVTSAIFELLA